mgnify:CR=1 FL=1
MTTYVETDKRLEANRRCDVAVFELSKIAVKYLEDRNVIEYTRIMGKIEGVKLAQDYFNQCLGDMTND